MHDEHTDSNHPHATRSDTTPATITIAKSRARSRITTVVLALAAAIALLPMVDTGVQAADMPGKGKTVQPIKATPPNSWFWHMIIALGLEELGYEVKKHQVADFPAAHLAVSSGDSDYTANNWKPLHDQFFERAGGESMMTRIGPFITGAKQGYLIDKDTADAHGISNLDQLRNPENAALFDYDDDGKANLVGCNPGWGCEVVIEHHLDAYELRDAIEHDQGSYFALIADAISRYENGESILYFAWTPHWLGQVLVPGEDVVWLDVPFSSHPNDPDINTETEDGHNLGFPVNDMYIVANNEFMENNPAARRFFEAVDIPLEDVNTQLIKMREGEDSDEDVRRHARNWIEDHRAQFNDWLAAARSAGD